MTTLHYLQLDTPQTLREGIHELRQAEAAQNNDASEQISEELHTHIDEHDVIHVLFGCSTDLKGEILAHVWALFGTTMEMQTMRTVNQHQDHRSALRDIGHGRLLGTWLRLLPRIVGTIRRARRMSKPFPVEQWAQFLEQPLKELRQQFGIRF